MEISARSNASQEVIRPSGTVESCRAAGLAEETTFATRPELATRMVARFLDAGHQAAWVADDEAYGGNPKLRTALEERGTGYVLAVACSHEVTTGAGKFRADILAKKVPKRAWQKLSAGAGAKGHRVYNWAVLEETAIGYVLAVPKSQQVPHFGRIDHLFSQAPGEAWERRSCGDGAKGPRLYHWAALQITSIAGNGPAVALSRVAPVPELFVGRPRGPLAEAIGKIAAMNVTPVTPSRPIDVAAVFPQLAPLARTATRSAGSGPGRAHSGG
jgi:hypothetical protein